MTDQKQTPIQYHKVINFTTFDMSSIMSKRFNLCIVLFSFKRTSIFDINGICG